MLNHLFSCFYGYPGMSASGILCPLEAPLSLGDVLTSGLNSVRGDTAESAEAFAIRSLKVIDGSTYHGELLVKDGRLSYDIGEIGVNENESIEFLNSIVGLSGAVITLATSYKDTRKTFSTSRILPERAAAILVGIYRNIETSNALG